MKRQVSTPDQQPTTPRRTMDAIGPRSGSGSQAAVPVKSAPPKQTRTKPTKKKIVSKKEKVIEEVEQSVASSTMVPPLVPEIDLPLPRKSRMRTIGILVLSVAIVVVIAAVIFFVLNP